MTTTTPKATDGSDGAEEALEALDRLQRSVRRQGLDIERWLRDLRAERHAEVW